MITPPSPPSPSSPHRPTPLRLTNSIRTLRFMHSEMTQAELGQRVGLTRQTIAAIEAGKYSPSLEVAFQIAEVFGKRLDEVFQRVPVTSE
ncbi:MAG: helix-turn-helix transcriptional regulator [Phycisphaerales bacterium]|nr:helix-turn-helix transcriptional regulator [Phycisphaerales bacterium]